jgi:hypothetical protein
VRLRIEVVEQPLGVQRAAGAGDGDEDFHRLDFRPEFRWSKDGDDLGLSNPVLAFAGSLL